MVTNADTEDEVVLLLTSFPEQGVARQIGTIWVQSQLAACVNLLPIAESIYQWDGKMQHDTEVLALVKTVRSRLPDLEASLNELHPYDLPELIVLGPEAGSAPYFAWIRSESTVDKTKA